MSAFIICCMKMAVTISCTHFTFSPRDQFSWGHRFFTHLYCLYSMDHTVPDTEHMLNKRCISKILLWQWSCFNDLWYSQRIRRCSQSQMHRNREVTLLQFYERHIKFILMGNSHIIQKYPCQISLSFCLQITLDFKRVFVVWLIAKYLCKIYPNHIPPPPGLLLSL